MEFNVGDVVEAYKHIIGWITQIDSKNAVAIVVWDDGNFDYNTTSVPFKYLEKVENQ